MSTKVGRQPFPNQDPQHVHHLRLVARAFTHLQDLRHAADYDGNKKWSRIAVVDSVKLAHAAFDSWRAVRKTKIAQDYLLQFLVQR